MGLDMYLEKRKKNSVSIADKEWTEIMYWRKANQIREWFATHLATGVENCQYSNVTKENLIDLVRDCKSVLDNPNGAVLILPTSSGFFFGGTQYNEHYYDTLENTIERLEEIIEETDWENEEVAYYEWW